MSSVTRERRPTGRSLAGGLLAGRRARFTRRRGLGGVLFVAPLAALAVIWQLLAEAGMLNEQFTPPPSMIVARMAQLATAQGHYLLWSNLAVSASRVAPAVVIAAVLGTALGVAAGLSRRARDYTSGILGLLLPLPAVAWTPVFVVSVGRGLTTMIIVLVLGAIFPILYNVMTGVQGINSHQLWAMRSLGGTRRDVLFRVVLPCAWPSILAGLRLGVGHAWRTLVAVELLTSAKEGLGALIFNSRASLDTTTMYVSVITLAAVGLLIDQAIFRPWEEKTLGKWGR